MGIEIERKFLVNKNAWDKVLKENGEMYRQGYILDDPEKTVRVRATPLKGFLTIKGITVGASRPEYEYEIPLTEAIDLLDQFCKNKISKTRYKIQHNDQLWEVDEFGGDNEGLIVAEVELKDENEHFELPRWVAEEVTNDHRYYNSNLSKVPFKNW
jgi:adenylate cyclase